MIDRKGATSHWPILSNCNTEDKSFFIRGSAGAWWLAVKIVIVYRHVSLLRFEGSQSVLLSLSEWNEPIGRSALSQKTRTTSMEVEASFWFPT